MIRLGAFGYQKADFYKSLGYEIVGHYANDMDIFKEYFSLRNSVTYTN